MIERLTPAVRHNMRVFAHTVMERLHHQPCPANEDSASGHSGCCDDVAEICRSAMADLQQHVTGMFVPAAATTAEIDTTTAAKN